MDADSLWLEDSFDRCEFFSSESELLDFLDLDYLLPTLNC